MPTAGRISNGALVEKSLPPIKDSGVLTLELRNPDYKTAVRIADAINAYSRERFHKQAAFEQDFRTITLFRPAQIGVARFMAEIGDLLIEPDMAARVVLDARTGTIVIGQDVQISTVAVTHGTLSVRITETPQVSQPRPFSDGKTVVTPQTQIEANRIGRSGRHHRRHEPALPRRRPQQDRPQAAGNHRHPAGDQDRRRAASGSGRPINSERRYRRPGGARIISRKDFNSSVCGANGLAVQPGASCPLHCDDKALSHAPRAEPPMLTPKPLFLGMLTAAAIACLAAPALPQDRKKPDGETKKAEADASDGVQQYCGNIANFAADARIAWQMKRMGELEAQLKQQIADLDAKEAEAKQWVDKREAMMKKADDGIVAIYAKMLPEAAASQMIVMEETTAAALLTKLNPRVSSAILNEMEAGKAAKLTDLDGRRDGRRKEVMMKSRGGIFATAGALCLGLAGCAADIGREPYMTPVGAGLATNADPAIVAFTPPAARSAQSLFVESGATIYRQQRASKIGDIVTVNIAINDQATLGNTTGRSATATATAQADWSLKYSGSSKNDLSSTSTFQGQGNIARSEQVQVSVAAIVTAVLPNGNLLLSGSQEVRVNYELRLLTVSGIVWPGDINRDNAVPYNKLAEARISYGGRGRLDEVQQPAWGQQIYDRLKPF